MGLDMYLYATKNVSSVYDTDENKELYKDLVKVMGAEHFAAKESDLRFSQVKVQLAYWRKANEIHNYFVKECAGGKDDCSPVYVEREQLEELLLRCNLILKTRSVEDAQEMLPTQSGFFFGSAEYDEWYFSDLEQTKKVLEDILNNSQEDWEFEYQASW